MFPTLTACGLALITLCLNVISLKIAPLLRSLAVHVLLVHQVVEEKQVRLCFQLKINQTDFFHTKFFIVFKIIINVTSNDYIEGNAVFNGLFGS